MMNSLDRVNFVGCHLVTRSCYHCGWECQFVVVDGQVLTEPSPSDYCIGQKHHERWAIFKNVFYEGNDEQDTSILHKEES